MLKSCELKNNYTQYSGKGSNLNSSYNNSFVDASRIADFQSYQ